jgi:hypothetical protein
MQAGWRALRGCGAARIGCPMAAPGSRRIGRLRVVSQGGRLDDSARGSGDGDAGPWAAANLLGGPVAKFNRWPNRHYRTHGVLSF